MLRYKLMQFMQGRYGVDLTFFIIIIISSVLSIICNFVFWFPAWLIIRLIVLSLIIYALFRALSKNIPARTKENRFVMSFVYKIKHKMDIRRQRRADINHVYRKCPNCKAVLRLPRRIGKHTTVCPKCNNEFSVKVKK